MSSRMSPVSVDSKVTKSSNASTLPSIVKAIHGNGVSYLYVSGSKKLDERFWDSKANLDFYNWQYHRNQIRNQRCSIDAEMPNEMCKLIEIYSERYQRRKNLESKWLEDKNVHHTEYTAGTSSAVDDYLDPIMEERRNCLKEQGEHDRQKKSKTISTENNKFSYRVKKQGTMVDVGKGDFYNHHLKQMYKLTRFPVLNSHLKVLPPLSQQSRSRQSPGQEDVADEAADTTQESASKNRKLRVPVDPATKTKTKTLVSARQATRVNQAPDEEAEAMEIDGNNDEQPVN